MYGLHGADAGRRAGLQALRIPQGYGCKGSLLPAAGYGSGKEIYRGKSAGLRGLWRYLYRLGQCTAAESGGERIPAQ